MEDSNNVENNEETQNQETGNKTEPTREKPEVSGKVTKKARWLIAIVLVALVGGIVLYFTFNKTQWNQIIGHFQEDETTEQVEKETDKGKQADRARQDDPLPKDAEKEGMNSEDLDDKDITTPDEIDKWGVKRPSFIISHSAYSTRESAEKIKAKLMDIGFNSGFYWIPDYHDSEKQLYKVFVGPYTTRSDAEDMLQAVKKIREEAYIMKLEKDGQ